MANQKRIPTWKLIEELQTRNEIETVDLLKLSNLKLAKLHTDQVIVLAYKPERKEK